MARKRAEAPQKKTNMITLRQWAVCQDSSVGIATRYGLDGPGIESRWGGEIFPHRPDRLRGPPSLLYNGYRDPFSAIERVVVWYWTTQPHPAPRLKEGTGIHLLNFMACSRVNLTFHGN